MNEIMVRKNGIEMYSTYNEGKPVIAESFIRTLKNKICKYMTWMCTCVHIKMSPLINWMINLTNIAIHIIAQLKWNLLM